MAPAAYRDNIKSFLSLPFLNPVQRHCIVAVPGLTHSFLFYKSYIFQPIETNIRSAACKRSKLTVRMFYPLNYIKTARATAYSAACFTDFLAKFG